MGYEEEEVTFFLFVYEIYGCFLNGHFKQNSTNIS